MALTIETFKTDKITAISVDDKSSGEFNYKSVKFAYDGGEVPLICIRWFLQISKLISGRDIG